MRKEKLSMQVTPPRAGRGRMRFLVSLIVLTATATVCSASWAASGLPAPTSDPFYSYAGSLNAVAPGTVLRTRQVQISLAGSPAALSGTQVLYRTTNQLGQPSATAATIIHPLVPGPTKLLSYQTFYDGDASTCRPSYTLQGGDPSNATPDVDESLMAAYAAQGFTVVTADYEGPTDDYGAGRESGQATLDAILAAEHQTGLAPKTAPVGMVGYSGGAIATMWAAELQPTYAPDLDIIGAAAGGIPTDFWHNVAYIDGSSDWAGAMPSVLLGLARAYKLDLSTYLSAEGEQIINQVSQGCLNPSAYPGLHFADMLKPQYKDYTKVPTLARILNDSIMGRAATPKEPLLMGVGDADGTGDGVMVTKDVQQLAYEYCHRETPVEFHTYSDANHDEAAVAFEPQALVFLQDLYNGQPVTNECGSIEPGNPLTPISIPTQAKRPQLKLRYSGPNRRLRGLVLRLSTTTGVLHQITIQLKRGKALKTSVRVASIGTHARRIILRVKRRMPPAGHYRLIVRVGRTTAFDRAVTIRAARAR